MNKPLRLIVEYEDGSRKEAPFNKVEEHVQSDLAKLGLCPRPGQAKRSKHYLLLRWKDGWQEVIGVARDAAELLRYLVIRRIEDRGRLSLDVGSDYPDLFIIKRAPMELTHLLIVGDRMVRSYAFGFGLEKYEGIFDDGGKREYVKYDKTDPHSLQEFKEAPELFDQIMEGVEKELNRSGLSHETLLAMEESQRVGKFREIARGIGVRGYEKQDDVDGFVEFLIDNLEAD